SGVLTLMNEKPYRSSTHFVQPASMLLGGSNNAMRGLRSAVPALATRSPLMAREPASSPCATSLMPLITYRSPARLTVAFAFHAALMARNALVSAGVIERCAPVPVSENFGGTIAAAIALVSKPEPGTLSNTTASDFAAV